MTFLLSFRNPLVEALTLLKSLVDTDSTFRMNVERDNLWDSFKEVTDQPKFNANLHPDVIFIDEHGYGEGAVDQGGPTVELITLLMEEAMNLPIWKHKDNQIYNRYLVLDYDGT